MIATSFDLKRIDIHDLVRSIINTIEARDEYTSGHSDRVATIVQKIASMMGFDKSFIEHIHVAGHLHDIGKIGIPDGILLKTGKLTDLEYRIVQQHATIGWKILKDVPNLADMARIIRHHHERFDGRGYPDGLSGDSIPIGSAIIAVADSFDAMTTTRTYRDKLTVEEALEELERCSGTQFKPDVVEAFALVVEEEDGLSEKDELICQNKPNDSYRSFQSIQ